MSQSIRIDTDLYNEAAIEGKANLRSTAQQINFWAKIGKNALANPDLPVEVIRDILIAQKQQDEPFKLGE